MKSEVTKLTILEIIYLCIFVNTSQLKEKLTPDSPRSDKTRKELPKQEHEFVKIVDHSSTSSTTSPFQYLAHPDLVGGLLNLLEDQIKAVDVQSVQKDVAGRTEKLSKLITEAKTRFDLVKSNPQLSSVLNSFISCMTASPATLLTNCMREGYYEQCEQIIQFFSLQDHPLASEARLAKKLDDLSSKSGDEPSEVAAELGIHTNLYNVILKGLFDEARNATAGPFSRNWFHNTRGFNCNNSITFPLTTAHSQMGSSSCYSTSFC